MPKLRNPGLYSFLIFLSACALVGTLYVLKAPDAAKLAAQLVAVVVATFGAKSALAAKPPELPRTLLPPHPRGRLETWPGPNEIPLVNTPITEDDVDEAPDTIRKGGRS